VRRDSGMELTIEEALALRPSPPPRGEAFGAFRIERKLGQGGMGVVNLARRDGDPRPVALKILSPKLGSNTECILQFHREAEPAIRIAHPNIIRG
jgi:serine/threonine protein kinase